MGTRAVIWLVRLVLLLAVALPWIGLARAGGPITATLLGCVTLTAAFHGAGLAVARLARRPVEAPLAIQWGIAAMIALGGVAMALQIATPVTQTVLVALAIAMHTGVLTHQRATRVQELERWLRSADRYYWIVPGVALVGFTVLHVLGAAGEVGARTFDDDGHHLAQLVRLGDTGALGDAVGFARVSQLGGQVVLSAFAGVTGELQLFRWVDNGLCLVLALLLFVGRLRPRSASALLWTLLALTVVTALAFAPVDPAACWSAIGLVVALYVTLDDHRETDHGFPIALIAGALLSLRSELIPVALCGLVAAWWIRRRPWRVDLIRIAVIVGVAASVVLPYLITRAIAWGSAPAIQALLPEGHRAVRLAMFGAMFATTGAVALLTAPRSLRWPALATLAGLAGIVSQLAGDRPYATQYVWPLVIALLLAIVIDLGRRTERRWAGFVLSLVMCVLIVEGRDTPGRLRWSRRISNLVVNTAHLSQATPFLPLYADAFAVIPRGAKVAVWVDQPEQLEYGEHAIFDLRTPRVARLRIHRWGPHASRLEHLVRDLGVEYLVLEGDLRRFVRQQADPFARAWCTPDQVSCDDDLELIARHHAAIVTVGSVTVFALRSNR